MHCDSTKMSRNDPAGEHANHAPFFSIYYQKRIEGLIKWAFPNQFHRTYHFNTDYSQEDEFNVKLLYYMLHRIEEKLKHRMQDHMNQLIVDPTDFQIVCEMTIPVFSLFQSYLKLFSTPVEHVETEQVRNRGKHITFNTVQIRFEEKHHVLPPLASENWCLFKWIDRNTNEIKRSRATMIRFTYSELTCLLSADLDYNTERFDSVLMKWVNCR